MNRVDILFYGAFSGLVLLLTAISMALYLSGHPYAALMTVVGFILGMLLSWRGQRR